MTASESNYEYYIGGSLPSNASSYVIRQADAQLYNALKAGDFCYVLNARQMGKSSLRVRVMQQLQAEGVICGFVDLTGIGKEDVTAEKWYAGIVNSLVSSCKLGQKFNWRNWWREQREFLSPIQRLSVFIDEILLVEIAQNIVIFIDEIDRVLSQSFSVDDFFALIRFFYNHRVDEPKYRRLTFALLGVATPADLIRDKTQTPFNIGKAIVLSGFKLSEVQPLINGLAGKISQPEDAIAQILAWTGGQPFLTQKLCRLLLEESAKGYRPTVSEVVKNRVVQNWEFQDEPEHLRTIRDRILRLQQKSAQLLGIYQLILQQQEITADGSGEQTELRLSGLVVQEQGKLKVYNRIYAEIFHQEWLENEFKKLRPYSEAFNAWVVANYQDESRLLRGQALQDALQWANYQNLTPLDYRFLGASQDLAQKEVQNALLLQAEESQILSQANETLTIAQSTAKTELFQAKRRAKYIISVGAIILLISTITALGIQLQVQQTQQKLAERQIVLQTLFSKAALVWDPFAALLQALEAAQQLKSLEKSASEDMRVQVTRGLQQAIYQVRESNRAVGHNGGIRSVVFSPDNKIFASASEDNTIKLWDVKPVKLKSTLTGHTGRIWSLSFHPNGEIFISSGEDKTIKLWNATNNTLIKTIENAHSGWVRAVSFSPDGKIFASCSSDDTIKLWKTEDATLIKTLKGHTDAVNHISFSPDGQMLASGSFDKTVRLWKVSEGRLINTLKGHETGSRSVNFSPDGKILASSDESGIVKLWNVADGTLWQNLPAHRRAIWSAIFSPDGKTLATISSDSTIKLWNLEDINDNRSEPQILKGHAGRILAIAFSADGKTLISGGFDNAIKLWDLEVKEPQTITENSANVITVSFSPNGKMLASGSDDYKIKLWNIADKKLLQTFTGHQQRIPSVAFSPDGNTLASGSIDNTVKLWNVRNGKLIKTLNGHSARIRSVRFSPDGKILASGSSDNTVKLWQTADGKLLQTFKQPRSIVTEVNFSPNGKFLAIACSDGYIMLLNLKTGTLVQDFPAHSGWVHTISYSPDGKILASGGTDSTIKLWNAENGKYLSTIKGHLSDVFSVSFSPDGKILASSSDDGTARVWNPTDGQEISTLEGHLAGVTRSMFSPDGKTLATVGLDNTIKLWNLEFNLDAFTKQACLWLSDYFASYPQEAKKFSKICSARSVGFIPHNQ